MRLEIYIKGPKMKKPPKFNHTNMPNFKMANFDAAIATNIKCFTVLCSIQIPDARSQGPRMFGSREDFYIWV